MIVFVPGTQALVRPGSPHSSISTEDRVPFAPVICLAKALVDSLPNPYDKEALRFKVNFSPKQLPQQNPQSNSTLHLLQFVLFIAQKGDIVEVLSMNASGIWRGRAAGRTGHFKFINVEVLPENRSGSSSTTSGSNQQQSKVGTLSTTMPTASLANRLASGSGPATVEELLLRIGLKEYTSVFVLNGYVNLL